MNQSTELILNLTKNAKHFSVRFSYTDWSIRSSIANLFRIGITMQEYNNTDRQLHWLSQVIAKVNKVFVPEQPDDSHTNIAFDNLAERITGRWFSSPQGDIILGLGDKKVSITYCPLCNTAVVYDRRLEFEDESYLLDFGVSGMLCNSDLVMWDRQTESWSQQLTGEALVGELAGAELNLVPSMLISLEEYFDAYPGGLVLSTETGHFSEYGTNPYTGYDALANEQPRLFKGEVDPRLPAMERVIDIQVDGEYKIYPLSAFEKTDVINDTFKGSPVVLFHTSKTVSVVDEENISESKQVGSVTVFSPVINDKTLLFEKTPNGFKDKQTGSLWDIAGKCISGEYKGERLMPMPHGNHFAFAWLAFYPGLEIFGK